MASTRNKNTYGNYNLEQRQYRDSENYELYKYSQFGYAFDTKLCGNGLLPGQMRGNCFSGDQYISLESFLFGINSTDLTQPKPKIIVPQLKKLESANIYENRPVILPQPLIVNFGERPFPV